MVRQFVALGSICMVGGFASIQYRFGRLTKGKSLGAGIEFISNGGCLLMIGASKVGELIKTASQSLES